MQAESIGSRASRSSAHPSAHACTQITFEVPSDHLSNYTDEYIVQLWHISQANPAPYGDPQACNFAEKVGREIIRRFVAAQPPALWTHQGRHVLQRQRMDTSALADIDQALLAAVQPGEVLTTGEILRRLCLGESTANESALRDAMRRQGFVRVHMPGGLRIKGWIRPERSTPRQCPPTPPAGQGTRSSPHPAFHRPEQPCDCQQQEIQQPAAQPGQTFLHSQSDATFLTPTVDGAGSLATAQGGAA